MRRIAVFAKPPVPGQVKTRLSPALPAPLACRLYEGMLQDALDAARGAMADERWLFWAGAHRAAVRRDELGFTLRAQGDGTLGERLTRAFRDLLKVESDAAVIIGADCPGLTSAEIDRAFAALEAHDVVLAPATDGGYVLIGLARPAPVLFENVSWSTAHVLSETRAAARRARLRVAELDALPDLDTPGDLIRWLADPPARGGEATRRALEELGLCPPARDAGG